MAPGGEMFRNPLHFGENVLPYGNGSPTVLFQHFQN